MDIPLYQVDAFAERRFTGNPAAVCPLERWLPDETLIAIAAENNLSETAFFVTEGPAYALRWFTPTTEVELCGHGTLAAAFVISTYRDPGRERIEFRTRHSGSLLVEKKGDWYVLDLPAHPAKRLADPAVLSEVAGAPVLEGWVAVKNMAVLATAAEVAGAAPVLNRVSELPGDGLILTAAGDDVDFVARYFAPHRGVDEDPVTGSAYCSLAPYWADKLGRRKLVARQLSRRGGSLLVEDAGTRVLVAGRAVPYFEGRIRL